MDFLIADSMPDKICPDGCQQGCREKKKPVGRTLSAISDPVEACWAESHTHMETHNLRYKQTQTLRMRHIEPHEKHIDRRTKTK